MTSQSGIHDSNVLESVCTGGLTVNYLFEPAVIVIYNLLSHVRISNNPQYAMSKKTQLWLCDLHRSDSKNSLLHG